MSEMRKSLEMAKGSVPLMVKIPKIIGWFLIGLGGILTITVIGIAMGLPLIFCGIFMLWVSSRMRKSMTQAMAAASERIEIAEHQLQKARAEKSSQ